MAHWMPLRYGRRWAEQTAGGGLGDDAHRSKERDRTQHLARFVRSDASPNPEDTGLGLAIVSAVDVAHGGTRDLDEPRVVRAL